MAQKITCSSCKTSFEGVRTCHCCGCHETFSSITAFDKHQNPSGSAILCKNPEEAGLIKAEKTWGDVWAFAGAAEGFWATPVANPDRTVK